MTTPRLVIGVASEVADWIRDGEQDIGRWAARGLGINLHDKQIAVSEAMDNDPAQFFLLYWANRAGKTLLVVTKHLHTLFYKRGIPKPLTEREYELWLSEDYRTLHTAPLNELAGRAHSAAADIISGTSPAQRDANGKRRDAPLGEMFVATTERDRTGADRMVVKCLSGATMDFRSTEGGGGRIEGGAWRLASWDEYPQQENPEQIRTVRDRLMTRLSDFDGKLLLTGTLTPETEHIAKEWIGYCEDPTNTDWWGSSAARTDNPNTSSRSLALAERNLEPEDYARTVLGVLGGVKGRLFPSRLVDPIFTNELPRFTPPTEKDGTLRTPAGITSMPESDWTYLHIWDIAIAAADNIGHVWRIPRDWRFSVLRPIVGVRRVEVPGSRTLTSAEIVHTIEETYLPYGGRIVVDATDAHGKNIARELRKAGYPVEDFIFNDRNALHITRKAEAIYQARALMAEGLVQKRDGHGKPVVDTDGVPVLEAAGPYGVLRLPADWHKARDQLSVLREDDRQQKKDEAMVVLMGSNVAYRTRKAKSGRIDSRPFRVFGR